MSLSKTGVAVVGLGYWGPTLLRNFRQCPDVLVHKVYDRNPRKVADIVGTYPDVHASPSLDDILLDPAIAIVVIATQAATHYELVTRALHAGKNVYVEKPPVMTLKQALEVADLSRAAGRFVFVDHTYVYSSPFRVLRRELGGIGDILHYSSNRSDLGRFQRDADVIQHLMYHDIYLLLGLLGGDAAQYRVVGASAAAQVFPGIYDTVCAHLQRPGLEIFLQAGMLSPQKERLIKITGDRGCLVWNDVASTRVQRILRSFRREADGRIAYIDHGATPIAVDEVETLERQVEELIGCFREGGDPGNLHEAVDVMTLLNRIREACSR